MPKSAPPEPDTFPSEDELDDIAESLPPVPEPTEFVTPLAGASAGEIAQQDRQFDAKMQRQGAAEGVRSLEESLDDLTERHKGGYLRVERIGPAELPRQEIGDLGKIKLKDLDANKDLQDLVAGQFGGGEYRVTAYTARGKPATTEPLILEIAGDIKPRSTEGHEYLNRRRAGDVSPESSGMAATLNLLREQLNKAQGPGGDMLAILAAVTTPMQTMMQTFLAQQNSTKERELAEIRAKSERELAELKAKQDREEGERKERLERERLASEERVKLAAEEAKAKQADAKFAAKYDYLGRKTEAHIGLRREELRAAGPLGIEGMKELRKRVVDAALSSGLGDAAGEDGPDWGARFMEHAVQPFVEKHGDKALEFLDRLLTKPGAPAPQRLAPPAAAAVPALPPASEPASTLDVDQRPPVAPADHGPPSSSTPPSEAAPAPVDEREAILAAGYQRVNVFLDAVAVQLKLDGDAAAAWDEAVDENPRHDLIWLYGRMPAIQREALASGGWPALKGTLDPKACAAAIAYYDRITTTGQAADWWTSFLEEGPWVEDDEE